MITSLHINNFAIIENLSLDFSSGFSVFSGETGAGKSILITALNLLLGSRALTEYIRSGQDSATVEGVFNIPKNSLILSLLEEKGIEISEDGQIFIKRKIFGSEKNNRCYLNHQPCSLSVLSEVGKWLVDIHGQHEHQFLLNPERHLDVLDAFGNLNELREEFSEIYGQYEHILRDLQSLQSRQQTQERDRDFLRFQMEEIDRVHLTPGEDESLEARGRQLQHAERLIQDTTQSSQELYETEGSIHERLSKISSKLKQLIGIDDFFSTMTENLENARCLVEDVATQCQNYSQNIEFDPSLIEEVEARLAEIQKLKRKYGKNVEEILHYRTELQGKWESMDKLDDKIEQLQRDVQQWSVRVMEAADNLSARRQKTGLIIEEQIKKQLADLRMPKARFMIGQEKNKLSAKGIDLVEFLFSANPGEEVKPLARIASGGEISRIMLALKTCLRSADQIPILIFDEVDVGIGGDISRIVGKKLKELALTKQLLCITHSPQIASLADHHYIVKKVTEHNRTRVVVEKLTDEQKIEELARMLGGGVKSETLVKHAQELIEHKDE